MSDRTRLIVVPPDGGPTYSPAPRIFPFRGVRPHELVVVDDGLLHTVVRDRGNDVTGCGALIPTASRIAPACHLQGHPLCPHIECFGDSR